MITLLIQPESGKVSVCLSVRLNEWMSISHSSLFADYSVNNAMEPLVYWIYVMEFSFYLHSLYTTLLIDQRRKDTYTLLFHHILCELLMIISYGNK